ncbi:MAG: hypothetical protein WA981_02935 [Glaciecola sp.]
MFLEITRAVLLAGLPLSILTYLLISRVVLSERFSAYDHSDDIDTAFKDMKTRYKQDKKKPENKSRAYSTANLNVDSLSERAINKWFYFGGGFYGIMGFVTFIYIEIGEIIGFIGTLLTFTWSQFLSSLTIDLLVNLIINAVMNLVDAFVWFNFWPKQITMTNGWIWLITAYAAYYIGSRLARYRPFTLSLARLVGKW